MRDRLRRDRGRRGDVVPLRRTSRPTEQRKAMKHMELVLLLSVGLICGCAPKIFLVDRQTVLEDEAAGEWPNFEKELLERAKTSGATPIEKPPESKKKARVYKLLNGDLVSEQNGSSTKKETPSISK